MPRATLGIALLVACNPPAAGDAAGTPMPPEQTDARCVEPPANALAVLADATCPWVLVPTDRPEAGSLALQELAKAAPRALAVAVPDECAAGCEYRGLVTEIGPVVIATRASRLREGAEQAFVGAALGGATIRFVSLWYDRTAFGDATPLGPSLALAPWICGTELVLAGEPRIAGADAEEASEGLGAAAGVYAIKDDELQRSGPALPRLDSCTRVPLELP